MGRDDEPRSRRSIDARTRALGPSDSVDPAWFWTEEWPRVMELNGERAAADAARLNLPPLTIDVGGEVWTLRASGRTITARPGAGPGVSRVSLDVEAFADLICEQRTALGLAVAGRVEADDGASGAFWDWDAVLRSALDGRGVHRPGEIELRSLDGTPLNLDQRFRLGDRTQEAAHFLVEAGFLLLQGVLTDEEVDVIDADLAQAVASAEPDDGRSWWASTAEGERYPCRILDFAEQSAALRELFADPRYLAVGELLDDGHRPGDPFGEHFAEVTAEGLVKRVNSVDGLVCLPWHKDCQRGGHAMHCSGMTIGVCLTPVDEAHGGLDVLAGSHRANLAMSQSERGTDLPTVTLRAERGDLTVHLSCVQHRSTHPTTRERRVAYTGFALPPWPGDDLSEDRGRLRRERASIGGPNKITKNGAAATPASAQAGP